MAISIDWGNKIINVPQSFLTLITGTLYELDTDDFRKALKDLEDDEEGISHPDTHRHNTEVTVAGTTFARTIEIINGYSVTFEDGQYTVRLVGSNNNIFDVENGVLNQNQVQVIAGNSAGLIVADAVAGVWSEVIEGTITAKQAMLALLAVMAGKSDGAGTATQHFRDTQDSKNRITATVDSSGNRVNISLDLS